MKDNNITQIAEQKGTRKLILTWLFGAGILVTLLLLMTISGQGPFLGNELQIWLIGLFLVLPGLSLLLGFYYFRNNSDRQGLDLYFFRFTTWYSRVYLLFTCLPFLCWPFFLQYADGLEPIHIIRKATWGLIPLNLIGITLLSILFLRKSYYAGPIKKILFLSANPLSTSRLRIDKEISQIDKELSYGKLADRFKLVQKFAVTTNTLQQAILEEKPNIIHFSGHGAPEVHANPDSGPKRGQGLSIHPNHLKEAKTGGIILENDRAEQVIVSGEALASLFSLFSEDLECVVLNSCYSEPQASAISQVVPFVIGMNAELPDSAAIAFSIGFYKGIGSGSSIPFSFELGKNTIQLEGLAPEQIPVIITKNPMG